MKSVAEQCVDRLLEAENPKVFLDRHVPYPGFQQVGGDYGDPWQYGGDWYDAQSGDIVHIDGLDGFGENPEKSSWDIELTPEDEAALLVAHPMVPDEDGDDENELERERAADELKEKKADEHNAAIEMPAYRFCEEPLQPDDWPDIASIKTSFGMSDEEFDAMPDHQKWLAVGQHHGFHELDHYPDTYTKVELSKYLGVEL